MITGFDIYILTRLDSIVTISVLLSVFGGIIWAMVLAKYLIDASYDDDTRLDKKILKISAPIVLIFILLSVFIPTSKDAAAIYLIPKVVNNTQVQQVPENAMKFLNLKLQEWIKDMEKK